MDINRVVQRAIDDEDYAKKLRKTATKAKAEGTGSPAWNKLLRQFKTNSRELAQLKADASCGPGSSRLVPLIKAMKATGAPKGSRVFKQFGTNSRQVKQLGCTSGGTTAVVGALQAMHFHAKPK